MINILEWDSVFFGFPVGQIIVTGEPDWEKLVMEFPHFRLVYFITPDDIQIPKQILEEYRGQFINKRILFYKKVDGMVEAFPNHIQEYNSNKVTQDFIDLAKLSGTFSRFRIDPKMPAGKFDELYNIWIKKSINGSLADKIFVSIRDEKVSAMVTCKINLQKCNIGLVAVNEAEQGRGTGKYLINKIEWEAKKQGISEIQVPTQSNNTSACHFYENIGFLPKEISNYYHFWIK